MCNTLSPLTNPPVDSKLESCHSSIARIYLSEERVARNRTPPSRTGTRIKPKRGSSSFVKHPSAKQTAGIARIISPPRNPPPPPRGVEAERRKIKESVKKNQGEFYSASHLFARRGEAGRGGSPYIRCGEKRSSRLARRALRTAFVAGIAEMLRRFSRGDRIRVKVSVPWRR